MIQTSKLEYSNGMFTVYYVGNEYKFSNAYLKSTYPEFYVDSSIKHVFYQPLNNRNAVVYKDGTKDRLGSINDFYQALIDKSNIIGTNYKISIYLEKSKLQQKQVEKVVSATPLDLFGSDVTKEDQDLLLKALKSVTPQIEIDNDFFYKKLEKLKIKVLKMTDWTQLADVQATFSEEEKAAWLEFRTKVRALDETKDPKSIRLPVPPKHIDWTND